MEQKPFLSDLQDAVVNKFTDWGLRPVGIVFVSPLFWLLCFTIVLFFQYRPIYNRATAPSYYNVNADTNGYTQYPYNIFKGETADNRTPVYPWFLKCIYTITGSESILDKVTFTETGTPIADEIVQGQRTCFYVFLAQAIVYCLVLIPFYYASKILLHNPIVHFFTVLFIAVYFIPCQSWILTEPLSISGAMVFFSLMIFYLNKPRKITAFLIGLVTLILVFLRPIFLYLVVLLAGFWIFRLIVNKEDRKQAAIGFLSLCLVCSVIYGYAKLNQKNYDYFTLSSVSLHTRFFIIYQTGFYKKSTDTEFKEYIVTSPLNPPESKYLLMDDLINHFGYNRIKKFVNDTIKNNALEFFVFNIKRMWWEGDIYTFTPHYFAGAFDFLFLALSGFYFRKIPWTRLGMWALVFGWFFLMFFGGVDCYDRLILPVLPVLFIVYARYADMIAQASVVSRQKFTEELKDTL